MAEAKAGKSVYKRVAANLGGPASNSNGQFDRSKYKTNAKVSRKKFTGPEASKRKKMAGGAD